MEQWKPIDRFNGRFEISDLGRLRNTATSKILKYTINPNGYYACSIKPDGRKGKSYCLRIHREIALAFIPNPNNLPQVNHIDGNKLNNTLQNLEWVTNKQNAQHAHNLGLRNSCYKRGVEHYAHKLSEDDVKYILTHYKPFDKIYSARALAKKFNVAHQHISKITSNENWKHISVDSIERQ